MPRPRTSRKGLPQPMSGVGDLNSGPSPSPGPGDALTQLASSKPAARANRMEPSQTIVEPVESGEALTQLASSKRGEPPQPVSAAVPPAERSARTGRIAKDSGLAEEASMPSLTSQELRGSPHRPNRTAVNEPIWAERAGSEPRPQQSAIEVTTSLAAAAAIEAQAAVPPAERAMPEESRPVRVAPERTASPQAPASRERRAERHDRAAPPAAELTADSQRQRAELAAPAPVIRVNIGRVELRLAQAPKAAPVPAPAPPRLSLREFMKQQ